MNFKYFIQFSFFLTLVALLNSCYRAPEFPRTPSISFTSTTVRDQVQYFDNLVNGDSLVINIRIQDGNGDIGLSANEISPPYQPIIYYDSTTGETYDAFNPELPLIKYGYIDNGVAIRTTLNDTIPNYEFPYTILNYDTIKVEDKLNIYYIQSNPDNKNIHISFFIKDNAQDEFEHFRIEELTGGNYDARIPPLSEDETPLESTLSYSMVAILNPFKSLFKDKIMKLRIKIKDHELNTSNTIETESFTLVEVQVN